MKKRERGFTLIELVAVIVIIALIALLIIPTILGVINHSKDAIHEEQIAELKKGARNWYIRNIRGIEKERDYCVSVTELIQTGYIDAKEIQDAKSDELLDGYILITYNPSKEKYNYSYSDTCDIDMSGFRLRLMNTVFNEANWAKTNVQIAVIGGADTVAYKYCISNTGECNPTRDVSKQNDIITLTNEGTTNYTCAVGVQKNGTLTERKCMGPYKIDKQAPELTISGDLTFKSSEKNLNLLQGVTVRDNIIITSEIRTSVNGILSEGIVGDYIISYTATDLAGNSTTKKRNVKIVLDDKDTPTVNLSVVGKPFNSNNWANKAFEVAVNTDDGAGSGVSSYTYCASTSANCTPNQKVNASTGKVTVSTESKTNYVCAYATDKTGLNSDKVCVGPYQLDLHAPTLTIPADEMISVSRGSYDINAGVTYVDNYTARGDISYSTVGTVSLRVIGAYPIKYTVIDQAGNKTTKTRTVTIGDTEPPHLVISNNGAFNAAGWAKKNFNINLVANDGDGIGVQSIKYCLGNDCTPNQEIKGTKGTVEIKDEGTNIRLCAIAIDMSRNESEKQCVGPYKLDKKGPTITFDGNSVVGQSVGTFNINEGVNITDNYSPASSIVNTNSGPVSFAEPGTKTVTYTATDQAGNTTKVDRSVVILDDYPPKVEIAITKTPDGTNNWYKTDIPTSITATDDHAGEVEKILTCMGTSECTPTSETQGNSLTPSITTQGASNYICAIAVDTYENQSTKVCKGPYMLDKKKPTISFTNNITIKQSEGSTYNIKSGVTVSDNITATDKLTFTATSDLNFAEPGTYTVNYKVVDLAGNTETASRTVTIEDDVAPAVSISLSCERAGENGWCRGAQTATLNVTETGGTIAQYQYSNDNSNWNNFSGPSQKHTTEGTYTVYYRVKDSTGNWSESAQTTINIDSKEPSCSLQLTNCTKGHSVTGHTKSTPSTGHVKFTPKFSSEWNGWCIGNTTPTVSFSSKSDTTGGSGIKSYGLIDSSTATYNSKTSVNVPETAGKNYYGYVKDEAGNVGSCSQNVKYEKAVTMTFDLSRSNNNTYNSTKGGMFKSDSQGKVKNYTTNYRGIGSNVPDADYYATSCMYAGDIAWFKVSGVSVTNSQFSENDVHKRDYTVKECYSTSGVRCAESSVRSYNYAGLGWGGNSLFRYTDYYVSPAGNVSNGVVRYVEFLGYCGY